MSSLIPEPQLILGPRPLPQRGGTGIPTFRQVPFIRINERIDHGCFMRKQLKKYLESRAQLAKELSNNCTSDIFSLGKEDVATSSCIDNIYEKLNSYNNRLSVAYIEASRELAESSRKLDNSSKLKKWNRDVYNIIQKSVSEVNSNDRKMERSILRTAKAEEEFYHWTRVHDANVKTLAVQPNNPDCIRGVSITLSKLNAAKEEYAVAVPEFEDCRTYLHSSITRRDEIVDSATEISQSVEEDHLESILMTIKNLIETKRTLLSIEQEALMELEQAASEMNVDAALQQFVIMSMQPELTHRQSKALYLLDWHYHWHLEQEALASDTQISSEVTENDIEIMKDFVASCFVNPDRSNINKNVSTKHRSRFIGSQAISLYRLDTVRKTILNSLNSQRCYSTELSTKGYDILVASVNILLDACLECSDTVIAKQIMNMSQTFYRNNAEYLQIKIKDHLIWRTPQFWGDALLRSISEEMSRTPQEVQWYHLNATQRQEAVLRVHNTIFGQLGTFIYNMDGFGLSRKQIIQFVQAIAFSFELSEEQKIKVISMVENLKDKENEEDFHNIGVEGDQAAAFAINIFPDEKKEIKRNPNKKLFDFNALSRYIGFSTKPSANSLPSSPGRTDNSNQQATGRTDNSNQQTIGRTDNSNQQTTERIISQTTGISSSTSRKPHNSWELLFGHEDMESLDKVSYIDRQRSSESISPEKKIVPEVQHRNISSYKSIVGSTELLNNEQYFSSIQKDLAMSKQETTNDTIRFKKKDNFRSTKCNEDTNNEDGITLNSGDSKNLKLNGAYDEKSIANSLAEAFEERQKRKQKELANKSEYNWKEYRKVQHEKEKTLEKDYLSSTEEKLINEDISKGSTVTMLQNPLPELSSVAAIRARFEKKS